MVRDLLQLVCCMRSASDCRVTVSSRAPHTHGAELHIRVCATVDIWGKSTHDTIELRVEWAEEKGRIGVRTAVGKLLLSIQHSSTI